MRIDDLVEPLGHNPTAKRTMDIDGAAAVIPRSLPIEAARSPSHDHQPRPPTRSRPVRPRNSWRMDRAPFIQKTCKENHLWHPSSPLTAICAAPCSIN